MAYFDTTWYLSSVAYAAVAQWAASTAYTVGQIVRQLAAPTQGNEIVLVCVVAGTTGATEPTWTISRGAQTVSGTATFQECSGQAALCGDLASTPAWAASTNISLGQIVKRASESSYQICTTAGTSGASEPAFSDTAGVTTVDGSVTWTSLGAPSNYAPWSAAAPRLATLLNNANYAVAGSTVFAASDHNAVHSIPLEVDLNSKGTVNSPIRILSVNSSGHVPPTSSDLLEGATESKTTGTFDIGFGYAYCWGVTFSGNSFLLVGGSTVATISGWTFEKCQLNATSATSQASKVSFGYSAGSGNQARYELINTSLGFGATADGVGIHSCELVWRDTPAPFNNNPPGEGLFQNCSRPARAIIERVDISNAYPFFPFGGGSIGPLEVLVKSCKAGTYGGVIGNQLGEITRIRSSFTGDTTDNRYYNYSGGLVTDTGAPTRQGGSTDGTTATTWEMYTNFQPLPWTLPFRSLPMAVWCDVVGSPVTATIYGLWDDTVLPNNDQIWAEVEYLGTSGSTLASMLSTRVANVLDVPAPLDADTSTWNDPNEWLTTHTPFKISVEFTPQIKGWVYARVCAGGTVAPPFGSFFVDPALYLS